MEQHIRPARGWLRTGFVILALTGCQAPGGSSGPDGRSVAAPGAAKAAGLPPALMRDLLRAARPCLVSHANPADPIYATRLHVWEARGGIALRFLDDDRPEFQRCVMDAVAAANIRTGDAQVPIEIPVQFQLGPSAVDR